MGTRFCEPIRFEKKKWGDVKKGYTHFRDGDVLLAKITPCFENGKGGIARGLPNGVGAGSTEYFVCRPNASCLLTELLHAFLKTPEFMSEGETQMTGSVGHKRVPKDLLLDTQLPLPPLPEQKRIADKLEAVLGRVDACRTRLDRVPALLKRFRQSVLAAATSGRLTEDWREENGLNDEWEEVELGSLIFDGPKNGLYKASTCYGQGTRILRIDNFYSGYINSWEGLKRLTVSNDELNDFGVAVGDIVVNRVNSMSHLGKSALVRELPEPCVFESNMMRIRLDVARITPDFCILALTSPGGIDQLQQNAKQAVNQASINQTDVKSVIVSLPTLPEQTEIVRRVEALFAFADRIEARLATAQATVARLTPSTLAKAFRGDLVPQDPDDEPAAALLERIAALKDVVPAKKVRAKRPPRA
jgi:type I restriction enzyme S subunit